MGRWVRQLLGGHEQCALIVAPVYQSLQDFAACEDVLEKFVRSAFHVSAQNLLTEGAALKCSQTNIEAKADKTIKLTLRKGNWAILDHSTFKPCKVTSKNPIDFIHGESSVVGIAQGKAVPVFKFQLSLLRVKHMSNTNGPQLGWAAIRLLPHAFVVLNHLDGFV